MKKTIQKLVFILFLSVVTTIAYSANVYYTFSPFFNLKGVGVILESEQIYGNLDLKGNYEKHIADSFRPNFDEDHFYWNYAINIGGGYRYKSFLIGADIGYLNKTKTYIHQFRGSDPNAIDPTTSTNHFLYGVNMGLKIRHLFLGIKYGNIELLSFKIGISF